jgi:hypothetical protein
MTDRKKPSMAFWATVGLVVVLVVYPLSFGPACWWFSETPIGIAPAGIFVPEVSRIYWPIGWAYFQSPNGGLIENAIGWYATLRDDVVSVPCGPSGAPTRVYRPY